MNKKFEKLLKSMSDSEIEDIAINYNVNIDGGLSRADAEKKLIRDLTAEEKAEILENS